MSEEIKTRLTLIEKTVRDSYSKQWALYNCQCGAVVEKRVNDVNMGKIKSCGCLHSEVSGRRFFKHGLKGHEIYGTWLNMKDRCYNPKCSSFIHYGGRGIKVCSRWKDSFENFLEDMGERPQGLTLDRIDSNGDYEPDNCRWATYAVQGHNKGSTILIEMDGTTDSLTGWCKKLGMVYPTTYARLTQKGWFLEEVFSDHYRINIKIISSKKNIKTRRNSD